MAEASGGLADWWNVLGRGARVAVVGGSIAILASAVTVLLWALRTDYAVLFSKLSEQDAAAVVSELKRDKIPYRLADGGHTIRVPAESVHETRLALVSSGAPLGGGVGFEIFDKQGLGATEQSQRVSYQRALQGELSRTIGAFEQVQQARVLLVIPESSLFRRERQEPRAAVSLTLQQGATLARQQIAGIQRLVAASVDGLDPARVVISDQRGITLSGPDGLDGAGAPTARLAMKQDIEEYFTRKIAALLNEAYGPGQSIVSVDVTLNFDEVRRTVQDLLPVATPAAQPGMRRKREVLTNATASDGLWTAGHDESAVERPASTSTDIEYEYGRRVEQVIAAPGSIEQMSIGVVMRGVLTTQEQAHVMELVRVAAGLNAKRGDAVVVHALEPQAEMPRKSAHLSGSGTVPAATTPEAQRSMPGRWIVVVLGAVLGGGILVAALLRLRRAPVLQRLTNEERMRLLEELKQALRPAAPVRR